MTDSCAANCFVKSYSRLDSDADLVTIIPVAVEITSAGICDTSPSPTVAIEYVFKTSENLRHPEPFNNCTTNKVNSGYDY